ncbi:MAG: type II toxin-antitoxin system HigB family toxin [Elusimicrobia bacterium]|nr:type II toxin-antitoxin system HigB family toxin [Elusimicrobiota bacterium]
MRIVGQDHADAFARKRPNAREPLRTWVQVLKSKDFDSLVDLKKAFGSADYVRPYTVFDIGGNKYRLIAVVDYELGLVSILDVLTHEEYDRGRWRK